MSLFEEKNYSFSTAFRRQRGVLIAIILRTIRTRFFGHGLGYLFAIGWPVSHILILIMIFTLTGRAAPFGESAVLFIGTGTVPFMVFSYLSRFMMVDFLSTRPLLSLPGVTALDVLIASALLETVSAVAVVIVMISLGMAFGIPLMPQSLPEAFSALGAAVLLGCGMGMLNSAILAVAPMWMTGYSLLNMALWASSGVVFVPNNVPEPFRTILSYNPALQVVEWMRAAYYEGYGEHLLDRIYTIGFGFITLLLGFLFERAMRGRILSSRG